MMAAFAAPVFALTAQSLPRVAQPPRMLLMLAVSVWAMEAAPKEMVPPAARAMAPPREPAWPALLGRPARRPW